MAEILSKDKQEWQRLFSLHKGIIKARWIYLAVFIVYGVSLATLTRTYGFEGYDTSLDIRTFLTRSWAIFWVISNFIIWFLLRLRKKKISLKGLKQLSYWQVGMDLLFVTGEFVIVGGLEGTTGSLYFFPLVISALLFPPIGVVITGALIVAIMGGIVLLDYLQVIQHFYLYAAQVYYEIAEPLVQCVGANPEPSAVMPYTSLIYQNPLILFFTYLSTIFIIIAVSVIFWLTSKILRSTELALRHRGEELEIERNKIEAVVTNLIHGLVLLDKEERIVLINPEAKGALGLQLDNAIGKRIDEIKDAPNLTKIYEAMGNKIEWTGKKIELTLGDPLIRHFQVLTSPVVTKNGERIGIMIVLNDVTREKEIEHLKTEFVSMAAHQLRTPLSAIKWTLKMALDGDAGKLTQDQSELLTGGYQSNERMIELVNDLLNVARIEEGRFIYDMSLIDLEEIIDNAIGAVGPIADKKKIKLEVIKPMSELEEVEADKEKIGLVVQNLIENSIKYTPEGGQVTISLKGDKMNLELMVKDTGIGIPRAQQEKVFGKFFRAQNAMRSGEEGTGMGLFIGKSIVEKHGGRIWFESTEGQGTTFWFTLPIKKIRKKIINTN